MPEGLSRLGLGCNLCDGSCTFVRPHPNMGKDLLYLKYLETAPWNLAVNDIGQIPKFSGVGRQLMEVGVRLSEALDFRGRIGLHALPQAEGFYRHCGMTEVGQDAQYDHLRYFEMTEEQARAFLHPGRRTK